MALKPLVVFHDKRFGPDDARITEISGSVCKSLNAAQIEPGLSFLFQDVVFNIIHKPHNDGDNGDSGSHFIRLTLLFL
jgi:hypothetical protein